MVQNTNLTFAVEGFLPAPLALLRIDHLPLPIGTVAVQPMKDFSDASVEQSFIGSSATAAIGIGKCQFSSHP
jgi:hypothetical protein